jgi:hypothetical protein
VVSEEATPTPAPLLRLPGEPSRAFSAFVAYALLGAGRSLERCRQITGGSPGALRQIERWSSAWAWVGRAASYDAGMAQDAARLHKEAYAAEAEEHRARARRAGLALYGVSMEKLGLLRLAELEYTPASLAAIARALVAALDIEAHALGVDRLLAERQEEEEV